MIFERSLIRRFRRYIHIGINSIWFIRYVPISQASLGFVVVKNNENMDSFDESVASVTQAPIVSPTSPLYVVL